MAVVTLTINDEVVSAREGQSLLEACRDAGADIPTLCHLDGLTVKGSCRLCVVELEGVPRPVPSCATTVREGMVVKTHTEKIMKIRKMILELIFSERSHVCAVCVMNKHCELQRVAAKAGMDHVRFDYLMTGLPMDTSHGRFGMDHNRCMLCYRCVRVCDEVEGAHTWDVKGRGANSRVITDLNRPWGASKSCTACGKCVQVCPTGALFNKGATVSEMTKEPEFLTRIIDGRRKKVWKW